MKVFLIGLFWPCVCTALINDFGEGANSISFEEFSILRDEVKTLVNRLNEKEDVIGILSSRVYDTEMEIRQLKHQISCLEDCKSKAMEEKLSDDRRIDQTVLKSTEEAPSNNCIEERLNKLEQLAKLNTLRNCHEYFNFGITTSGLFTIDPDGPLTGNQAFDVYCSFENGKATTKILHNFDDARVKIPHCDSEGCYQLNLTYSATMEQITALKEISETCEEDIELGFQCKGSKYIAPDSIMDSCSNMKISGLTTSTNYVLNNGRLAYCQMDKEINDPNIQKNLGIIPYDGYEKLMFLVVKNDEEIVESGKITFNVEEFDNHDVFNDGIFTAPEDGLYEFNINGFVYECTISRIDVKVNESMTYDLYDSDGYEVGSYGNRYATFIFSINLKRYDQVYLDNGTPGCYRATRGEPMTFIGRLIM